MLRQKPINPFAFQYEPMGIIEAITVFLGRAGYAFIERQVGGAKIMVLHRRRDNQWHPVRWIAEMRPNTDGKQNGLIEAGPLAFALEPLPLLSDKKVIA